MANYTLNHDAKTLHSYFSPELPPILTIESGDSVRYNTFDAGGGFEDPDNPGTRKIFEFSADKPLEGHALSGPIEIKGAKKRTVLEIQIGKIRPGKFGWTYSGGTDWEHFKQLRVSDQPGHALQWTLDPDQGIATTQHGQTVKLAPFMGVMGMSPNEPGKHSTIPPRFCGGNMDCRALVAGSTLFLPIAVDGGLFSVGDGHGAQGDGEISGTAIECPMDHLDLTFTLRLDLAYTTPHANTPSGWLTMGFDDTLEKAMYIAINAMLDLMMAQYNINRKDALALASIVVDMKITQVVNGGIHGVHAILPHGAITG